MTGALLIAFGALLQVVLGCAVPSAWLVPDLILACLAVAVSREAESRVALAVWAALLASLFSARQPAMVAGAYLAAGWGIIYVASLWDLTAVSVQRAAVGFMEACLTAVWILPQLAQGQIMGLAGSGSAKIVVTVLCLPLVRRLSRWVWRDVAASP